MARLRRERTGHGKPLGFKTIIKPSKTAIKRHVQKLRGTVRTYKHMDQKRLIRGLNPVIVGWTGYYRTAASRKSFEKLSQVLFRMLMSWAKYRHPRKSRGWIRDKYWRLNEHRAFRPRNDAVKLHQHYETAIRRHVKVQNIRSPYDGDWVCQMRGLQPGPINTFPKWQALGRYVKRGERALTLCMPITRKRRGEESDVDESNGEGTFTSFVYKARWFVGGADGRPRP